MRSLRGSTPTMGRKIKQAKHEIPSGSGRLKRDDAPTHAHLADRGTSEKRSCVRGNKKYFDLREIDGRN